ncbi:MAG TPA: NADP-dependent oxidoreductase [Devosia sp.]|jgi:NADPH:quinone reductase-like Zn-dependent oxidoreductase|uniref:quinone oxidoreductase family protein n=1 Tax=Devosia sp. TaxID=1871048 RepID=UPI002F95C732
MQAIIVKEFGSADQLSLGAIPDLVPGEGEVVIQVEAAGVGLVDVLQRQGFLGVSAPGYIPGVEVAGRVMAVGPSVDEHLKGQRVFAMGQGGYAQQFLANAKELVPLPEQVSSETAVSLGVNALVASFSITRARLEAGERLLVRGASGGIGAMVAQLAVRRGAVVTAVTSPGMADSVAALGVQHVVRRGTDSQPKGPFDVIIDPVAGEATLAFIETLAFNGRYIVNGAAAGFPPAAISQVLLQGFTKSPTYSLLSLDSVPQEEKLAEVTALFAQAARGELKAPIAQILPLREAAEAHRMLEAGGFFGKVVLKP